MEAREAFDGLEYYMKDQEGGPKWREEKLTRGYYGAGQRSSGRVKCPTEVSHPVLDAGRAQSARATLYWMPGAPRAPERQVPPQVAKRATLLAPPGLPVRPSLCDFANTPESTR